jgi:NitT/TauT family transport system ATP-binding protein
MNPIITFKNISKSYGNSPVLHDIDLVIPTGSFTVLVGPSGCGKSTLLKILTGIEKPDSGTVSAPETLTMVFQNGSLLPWRTVYENIAIGLETVSISKEAKDTAIRTVISLMEMNDLIEAYPRDLSGGQRQRVGIARALVSNPSVLLLDEPFSALDAETTENLHTELLRLWKEKGLTILMVSHSLDEAVELADVIHVMKAGRILQTEQIELPRPRDPSGIEFHNLKQTLRQLL